MACQWLIIASIFAIAVACPHSQQQQLQWNIDYWKLNGTDCSVFNHSKRCCRPEAECSAMNRDDNTICSCSPICYSSKTIECCKDNYCPTDIRPKTCQDYGCCYEKFPSSLCEHEKAYLYLDDETGYTEIDCSNRTDSCPKTCIAAKKSIGNCEWQYPNISCYVEQGKCYCDHWCGFFEDCCEDVAGLFDLRTRFLKLIKILRLRLIDKQPESDDPSHLQYKFALSARLMSNHNSWIQEDLHYAN